MSNAKSNRRVKYTKMVLRQSLLKLMETRPINKITVTEICQGADINRGTFYAYYADTFDLLAQIENELYDKIMASYEKSMSEGGVSGLLGDIFTTIAENADLCRVLFSEMGDREFIRRIVSLGRERSIAEWKAYMKNASDSQLEAIYAYTANGFAGVIANWVNSGMQEDPVEMARFLEALSNQGLKAFIGDNANFN